MIMHDECNKNEDERIFGKYTQEFIEKEANAFEEWMRKPENIYVKRFALERGYSFARLSEFAQVNQRFAEAYEIAHDWQEVRIVEGYLRNEFNPGFCKFILENVCGSIGRKEMKINSEDNLMASSLEKIFNTSRCLVNDK